MRYFVKDMAGAGWVEVSEHSFNHWANIVGGPDCRICLEAGGNCEMLGTFDVGNEMLYVVVTIPAQQMMVAAKVSRAKLLVPWQAEAILTRLFSVKELRAAA